MNQSQTEDDPQPYRIQVQINSSTVALVEFRVLGDDVEVWHHDAREGTLHRRVLIAWLTDPAWAMPVGNGTALFLCEAGPRITLSLSDLQGWTLTRQQVAELLHRLRC